MLYSVYQEPWLRALLDQVLTYDIYEKDLVKLHKFEEDKLLLNQDTVFRSQSIEIPHSASSYYKNETLGGLIPCIICRR